MQAKTDIENELLSLSPKTMPLFIPEEMVTKIIDIKKQNPSLKKISIYESAKYGLVNLPCSILFDDANNKIYAIGKKINKGNTSVVKYTQDIQTKGVYAIKRFKKDNDLSYSKTDNDKEWERVQKEYQSEVETLKAFGRYITTISIEESNKVYQIQTLQDGDPVFESLHQASKEQLFNETHLLEWIRRARNCCVALNNFHKKGYIHRDVNEGNFLVNSVGMVTLVDFCSAIKLNNVEMDVLKCNWKHTKYKAPETDLYASSRPQNQKYCYTMYTDIYCLGITFEISLNLIRTQILLYKDKYPNLIKVLEMIYYIQEIIIKFLISERGFHRPSLDYTIECLNKIEEVCRKNFENNNVNSSTNNNVCEDTNSEKESKINQEKTVTAEKEIKGINEIEKRFFWHIKKGDRGVVADMVLAQPRLLEAKDSMGRNPLTLASEMGTKEIVKYLLKQNMDINKKDDKGLTALHRAILNGKKDMVLCLLEHGADVNISMVVNVEEPLNSRLRRDERTITFSCEPLYIAMTLNDPMLIDTFIKKGAIIRTENYPDNLHYISDPELALRLVEADLQDKSHPEQDRKRQLWFFYILEQAMTSTKCAPGQERNSTENEFLIKLIKLIPVYLRKVKPFPFQANPLHTAAECGSLPLFKQILALGFDLNETHQEALNDILVEECDTLKYAVNEGNNPELVKFILQHPNFDPTDEIVIRVLKQNFDMSFARASQFKMNVALYSHRYSKMLTFMRENHSSEFKLVLLKPQELFMFKELISVAIKNRDLKSLSELWKIYSRQKEFIEMIKEERNDFHHPSARDHKSRKDSEAVFKLAMSFAEKMGYKEFSDKSLETHVKEKKYNAMIQNDENEGSQSIDHLQPECFLDIPSDAFREAFLQDCPEMIDFLIKNVDGGEEYRDSKGNYLIHLATESENLTWVQKLSPRVFDCLDPRPNNYLTANSKGLTPLDLGKASTSPSVVYYFDTQLSLIDNRNDFRSSVLSCVRNGDLKLLQELETRHKIDFNLVDPESSNNFLHVAISAFPINFQMVEYLLDKGINVNQRDRMGKTALFLALERTAHVNVIKELLRHGASINQPDSNGDTPLSIVIKKQWVEPLALMLKMSPTEAEGAFKDSDNEHLFTSFAQNNNLPAAVLLLQNKMNPEVVVKQQDNLPIFYAYNGHHKLMVNVPLAHGAKENGVDCHNNTIAK